MMHRHFAQELNRDSDLAGGNCNWPPASQRLGYGRPFALAVLQSHKTRHYRRYWRDGHPCSPPSRRQLRRFAGREGESKKFLTSPRETTALSLCFQKLLSCGARYGHKPDRRKR